MEMPYKSPYKKKKIENSMFRKRRDAGARGGNERSTWKLMSAGGKEGSKNLEKSVRKSPRLARVSGSEKEHLSERQLVLSELNRGVSF